MSQKVGKNQVFGDWKLKKFLGGGGNGDVWLVANSRNEEAAIKLLRKIERKTYSRFINEVNVIKANSDIEGILPILDSYLPDIEIGEIPWYVMPVAQPLENYLDDKYFEDVVMAIEVIAKTLYELHKRDISHRDIKPENLLVRNEKIYLADFGLVDYPDKINITSSGDIIGAKWTMAPEMRREGNKSDGKPADVYSLAKTFWILLTRNKKGFDGQYFPEGVNGIRNFPLFLKPDKERLIFEERKVVFTKPVDDILQVCTNDDPNSRLDINQLCQEISKVEKQISSYSLHWQAIQEKVFPSIVPTRVIWEDINDIVQVLKLISPFDGLNHMLYPDGGGLNLIGCQLGQEPHTIELLTGGPTDLVKPKRLVFENFGSEPDWNYFRLETDKLESIDSHGVYNDTEELLEITPLNYISAYYWYEGEYNEEKLPPTARLVRRFLKGSFVIVQQTSPYNGFDMYSGLHNRMTTDNFRKHIKLKLEIYNDIINDYQVEKFAADNQTTPRAVAINYLREKSLKVERKRIRKERVAENERLLNYENSNDK